MNNKRKFLVPLTALASVFISANTTAGVSFDTYESNSKVAEESVSGSTLKSNDVFNFILKTPAFSQVMARHSSHSSHSSHGSHSSHSSHQSGY